MWSACTCVSMTYRIFIPSSSAAGRYTDGSSIGSHTAPTLPTSAEQVGSRNHRVSVKKLAQDHKYFSKLTRRYFRDLVAGPRQEHARPPTHEPPSHTRYLPTDTL